MPEPASIALAVLSQIYLEQNKLGLAQKYLAQAIEVDPNPTSTNMTVQIAFQRAEIQIAQGNFSEALNNIRSVRELHLRRPSGMWTDQDLLAYEAFIFIREGDMASAEGLLNESVNTDEHGLSRLVRAEILLMQQRSDASEKLLNSIISESPIGILSIPLMYARVLLVKALFNQHKINQALHLMKEAIRLAAPEHFIRPFLECAAVCMPLFSLALQTESLTNEAQAFIRDTLQSSNYHGSGSQMSQVDIESLSTSASVSLREQEVLRLINEGHSNREIAGKLSISESTVKTHVGNIYFKLNVNSRVQAITRAKELKLV